MAIERKTASISFTYLSLRRIFQESSEIRSTLFQGAQLADHIEGTDQSLIQAKEYA